MRVAIVGGGISGLSAAYYLAKAGVECTLVEKSPRLGGLIQTEQVDGCLVECGPDSFLSAKPWAMDLIGDLGLAGEVIGSNDHLRKTFIWKGGRMIQIPDGLQFGVPTRIGPILSTSLLSWKTKSRMALDFFRRPPPAERADCPVSDFFREHYGQEAVDYLAEPLLAGVYGGTPETLSVKSVLPRFVEIETKYGSLSRGMLAERGAAPPSGPLFRTLKGGLGTLIDALRRAIEGKVTIIHGEVEAIVRGYRLRVAGDWLRAERLALACESHAAAALAQPIDPELGRLLAEIPHSSATVVALGFDADAFRRPPEGFGFLAPRLERKRLVACTFMGTKFPNRVPKNKILLRCFMSGSAEDGSLGPVLDELREKTALRGDPQFARMYRWPRSMAQYTVGHSERMAAIEARLNGNPGLYLVGNAYYGIGIPDCIRLSKALVNRVVD